MFALPSLETLRNPVQASLTQGEACNKSTRSGKMLVEYDLSPQQIASHTNVINNDNLKHGNHSQPRNINIHHQTYNALRLWHRRSKTWSTTSNLANNESYKEYQDESRLIKHWSRQCLPAMARTMAGSSQQHPHPLHEVSEEGAWQRCQTKVMLILLNSQKAEISVNTFMENSTFT